MRALPGRPGFWFALGLVLPAIGIFETDASRSELWFTEWILFALLIALYLRGGLGWRPGKGAAMAAAAALSWAFGMVYETSLTVDGSGIGGVHPDTRMSFLLAQGDYVPLALVAVAAVWWWRLDVRGAVFFAMGIALTEALIFAPVLREVLFSPAFFMSPLFFAYFALVYASFLALPFLIVAPDAVHRDGAGGPPPAVALIGAGIAAGFLVRLFWGLVYSPLVQAALE